jgi:hypothetical protein
MRAAIVAMLVAGCSGGPYLVVTVDARPAVHDTATLTVTLHNGSDVVMHQLAMGSHTYPVHFSVDAPGRTGALEVDVEADDASGTSVGYGTTTTTVGATSVELMVDTTDFVVNTDFAMDQYLSADFDFDSHGLQLSATSDGNWTVGFRDNCNNTGMCNMYARRFDNHGVPVRTAAAAGTNQFVLTTTLTDSFTELALAASGTTTLAVWNSTDTVGSPPARGVACRALDAMGNPSSGQLSLSSDASSVVSIAPLSNTNFAIAWEIGSPPTAFIRTIIAKPDCTSAFTVSNVSASQGAVYGPESAHVAANGMNVMYAWVVDGDVYVRPGANSGPIATEIKLLPHTATQQASGVRLAPMGTGFALVVRWVNPMTSGPGKIELFQVSPTGGMSGAPPTLISDQTRSDFVSGQQSPGVAVRASDGALLIVWHQCDDQGSVGSCDVYGRMVRPNATTSGPQFMIPTITTLDQTSPSAIALPDGSFAVAWNDQSHIGADMSGYAVHARILYPAYDPNGTM